MSEPCPPPSPPPLLPGGPSLQPPLMLVTSPMSTSTLNPYATPFFPVGLSSSHPSVELPSWLRFSPSSSSSLESERPPVMHGKGKQLLIDDSPAKGHGEPTPSCPRSPPRSGFMVAARWTPPQSDQLRGAGRVSARVPEPLPSAGVEDRWQTVTRKKKKKKKPPPPKRGGKVPADLICLCFNCFTVDHVVKCCLNQACCIRC
jgi:hypothetical protein